MLRLGPIRAALALTVFGVAAVSAQDAGEIEGRLPSLTGLERARVLAELTDAYRGESPEKAIAYGNEALEILADTPEPETAVKTLNELAWAHMVSGDRERATELAGRGRDLAETNDLPAGEARATNVLGVIARRWGEPLKAIELFTEALGIYRDIDARTEVATSLNNLGVVYSFDLADYREALEYQLQALEIRRELGDQRGLALSYNNIGVIYQRLRRFPEAREHYLEALALRRELGVQHRVAGTLHNLGDLALDGGELREAVAFHEEALEIRSEIRERTTRSMSMRSLALAHGRLGEIERAEGYARRAVAESEAIEAPQEVALSLLSLAEVNRLKGNLERGAKGARRALALAEESSATDVVRRASRDLAAIEEQAGRHRAALAAYRRFKEVSDEIFDEDGTRRVEILESRYQAERREREIERLSGKQALQALEIARQRQQRSALVFGSGALALLAGGLFWRHREVSRLAHELSEANRKLGELSMTDVLSGLRNRRYLHETIEADLAASRRGYREAAMSGEAPANSDVTFVLLDVDHFKAVNDTHGHDAGDAVIRQIAARLREICRGSDVIVRWGGEEFLIVKRGADRSEAANLAERLRTSVADLEIGIGERTIRRTTSIGYACYPFVASNPEAVGWEQVVALADDAMYLAKHSGRNAWVGLESTDSIDATILNDPSERDVQALIERGHLQAVRSGTAGREKSVSSPRAT